VSEVRIVAEPRTEFGKGGARRTRRAGKVPAVLYGHGSEPRHVSLPGHDLMRALKGGANTLLRLDLGGGTELALPRAVTRNPIKGSLEHLDLLLVRQGEKVTVDVPIELTGDAPTDGLVDQQVVVLSVEAEATHIPTSFSLSIQGLRIGGHLAAKDVPLPAGVTLAGDPDTVIVHVMAEQSAEQFEVEMEEAEADVGAGASGAAEQAAAAESDTEAASDSADAAAAEGDAGSGGTA
jgi:large subunit ribosomal protein L25